MDVRPCCAFENRWYGRHTSVKFEMQSPQRPSLGVLNALYEYDDFMESIRNLVDLGCGTGEDLAWWATRTTRSDSPQPLNIKCVGVDTVEQLPMVHKYANVTYQRNNFEGEVHPSRDGFDVLWCHDAFQYCLDPVGTLGRWKQIASPGAMLVISVPETMTILRNQATFHLPSGVFYHYTLVNLIYMLAVNGWDCRSGFFQKLPQDPWIRAVVYKSDYQPEHPTRLSWYDLVDLKLLPETADKSILAHGYLQQQDLVVPWLDQNLTWMGKQ
jgi:SAM-dependent methyltransferase